LLVGRLIYYDALNMSFEEIKMRWNKTCPYAGTTKITSIQEEMVNRAGYSDKKWQLKLI
jgi:adenylyltransferase/sulfurtransferase